MAPPTVVSEELYQILKNSPPSPLRGFVGIACSYSGKFFGGYARSGDRNYALNGYNTAMKTKPLICDAKIIHADYKELKIPEKSLIYCDPPYRNTTGYNHKFCCEDFWNWCRERSGDGHTVIISEYSSPDDFKEIWSKERNLEMRTNKNKSEKRVEKLFIAR